MAEAPLADAWTAGARTPEGPTADLRMTGASIDLAQLLKVNVDAGELVERLRAVIDPELGVNIVDLGLVYGAEMVNGVAQILMTTTTPACPIGSYLSDEIQAALFGLDGVLNVEVELTHDPPWSPDRMSDEAKVQLGWAR
ncbi:MAG TPA: metal-sulfur cluster assembly factor [Candidatus Saccharimonadales bacterium]|nr:metal-sulfur cluster assembly factor [Candidatus Saccharimonadales bacterium]